MTRRFLSWFGLLAILGLLGAGVASLMLVKDRIRVVVQDDTNADPAVQRIAQLEDQLKQVHSDVRALAEALGKGLQQLADAQAQDADGRQQELGQKLDALAAGSRALAQDVATVRAQQTGAERTLASLSETMQSTKLLANAGSASTSPGKAEPVPGEATPTAPAPPTDKPAETAPTAPPNQPAATASTPAAAPRKRSAFAFQLPSQQFRFDLAQGFELIPSLSRVGFDAKSTLHDFTGVTSKLAGKLHMNLAQPATGCSGEIRVDAATLNTGLVGRDDAMREHLATGEHQEIVFAFASMTADQVDATTGKSNGTVRGRMTIRGQTRDFAMPVRLSVDDAKRVHADGEAMLKLSDYGVPVPSQLGMIKMQDEVKVWIALQARALGEATKR